MKNIFSQLGASDRTRAVTMAMKRGFLDVELSAAECSIANTLSVIGVGGSYPTKERCGTYPIRVFACSLPVN
jgi:hypothetical protein